MKTLVLLLTFWGEPFVVTHRFTPIDEKQPVVIQPRNDPAPKPDNCRGRIILEGSDEAISVPDENPSPLVQNVVLFEDHYEKFQPKPESRQDPVYWEMDTNSQCGGCAANWSDVERVLPQKGWDIKSGQGEIRKRNVPFGSKTLPTWRLMQGRRLIKEHPGYLSPIDLAVQYNEHKEAIRPPEPGAQKAGLMQRRYVLWVLTALGSSGGYTRIDKEWKETWGSASITFAATTKCSWSTSKGVRRLEFSGDLPKFAWSFLGGPVQAIWCDGFKVGFEIDNFPDPSFDIVDEKMEASPLDIYSENHVRAVSVVPPPKAMSRQIPRSLSRIKVRTGYPVDWNNKALWATVNGGYDEGITKAHVKYDLKNHGVFDNDWVDTLNQWEVVQLHTDHHSGNVKPQAVWKKGRKR